MLFCRICLPLFARSMVCVVGFPVANIDCGCCAETATSLATGDQTSTEWEEQIVAEEVVSAVDEEVPVAARQHGWTCPQRPRQCCVFFFLLYSFDVVSLPVVETQKSRWKVSSVGRRKTGFFVTVWDLGFFDPARCAHLPGDELRNLTS